VDSSLRELDPVQQSRARCFPASSTASLALFIVLSPLRRIAIRRRHCTQQLRMRKHTDTHTRVAPFPLSVRHIRDANANNRVLVLLEPSFVVRCGRESAFAIMLSLKIPPHLKCVATLPCEMSMS